MAKISIIIPIYNMEKYLRMCLDSVLNQSFKDFEVILIDDGSTDSSPSIIEEYRSKYPDVVRAYREDNAGQGKARNYGISLARGEYIGFVDADDYIEPAMYERMYNSAMENDSDLVECDYKFLLEKDGVVSDLPKYGDVRERTEQKELFINPLVSPWNKLIKGEVLKKSKAVFPEGVIYEDTSFYIKLIPFIHKMSFVPEAFVNHFKRMNSTMTGNTGAKSKRIADIFPVLQDIIDFYEDRQLMAEYREEIEYFVVKILLCSSLERIATINDKELRNNMLDQTWDMINKSFPNYKKNYHMKGGKKNLYMKVSNRWVSGVFVNLLHIKQR